MTSESAFVASHSPVCGMYVPLVTQVRREREAAALRAEELERTAAEEEERPARAARLAALHQGVQEEMEKEMKRNPEAARAEGRLRGEEERRALEDEAARAATRKESSRRCPAHRLFRLRAR
jgi:hypothetical protein